MRAVLTLLAAAVAAAAQTADDARPLVQSIVEAVRSAGSVRAEGVSVETGGSAASGRETHFELVTQGPLLLRYRAAEGPNRVIRVCDGTSRWDYSEVRNSFTRATGDAGICTPPVARWADLTDGMTGAKTTGQDRSEFEGASRECTMIEVSYVGSRLTLCVDPARRMILRERTEAAGGNSSTTITYSRVAYGPPQAAEVFLFQIPAGSTQGGVRLPLAGEGGSGSYAGPGPGSTRPLLISKSDPEYSPEAIKAQLRGAVVIRLVVDENGVPRDMKVVRGLGMGLDEKAVEAVSGWRFKPGTRAGQAVEASTLVEVHFRLP